MKHLTLTLILALVATTASAESVCINVGTPQQRCFTQHTLQGALDEAIATLQPKKAETPTYPKQQRQALTQLIEAVE